MYFEIFKDDKLIKRGTEMLNTPSWSNELMYTPSMEMVLPIDYLEYVDGREEVKVYINDKIFWGIIHDISVDKVNETISLSLEHIISEWEYRQISVNHAMSNKALNIVYKGDKTVKNKGNDETITASDFTVSSKRIKKMTTAKWIAKSRAAAWRTSNGNKVKVTKVDDSAVKTKTGSYNITFSTAKGTSVTVKVTVEEAVTVYGTRTHAEKDNNETISARPISLPYEEAQHRDKADIIKYADPKAWVYRKKSQEVEVTSVTTTYEPEIGKYNLTASTAKGTSITVNITVREDESYANVTDPSVVDKLEDIYSDYNFAYPGWQIDIEEDAQDEMIDYVYSRQNKLEALTKTCELTDNLFWRVGFTGEKIVEISSFGEKKPYILSLKPSGKTNTRIITEPTIDYDFDDVVNVATVYSEKSDTGMSSLTLREVYMDTSLQKSGFPVVILRANVNNERDYSKYITQYPKLAPNNELEYAVLDEQSIALESGHIIEGTFAFNDLGAFNINSKKIPDSKRVRAARTVYHAAIRKLKQKRRSYTVRVTTEELPADLNVGDRIRLIYDNNLWEQTQCSNYWKKILKYNNWFYVTSISYNIEDDGSETNEVTLAKWLRIERDK